MSSNIYAFPANRFCLLPDLHRGVGRLRIRGVGDSAGAGDPPHLPAGPDPPRRQWARPRSGGEPRAITNNITDTYIDFVGIRDESKKAKLKSDYKSKIESFFETMT